MKIKKSFLTFIGRLSFLFLLAPRIYAFEFTPSVVEFAPEGRAATQKYNIYNSLPSATAIEISSVQREIDESGKETLLPNKDFNIYPRLFTLRPGETRVIKATYIGDKKIQVEKAYRIVAEQLSVDTKKKEDKKNSTSIALNFLYKYETSVYVIPPGAAPKVEVNQFKVIENSKKERILQVDLVNSGTAHQVFQKWSLELHMEGGKLVTLSKKEIKDFPEFNLLAEHKIRIQIVLPEKIKTTPQTVSFKIDSE